MHHAGLMNEINGLPLHVLIVHFVVVGVPLAALLTVLSAAWPKARARLGIFTPIIAFGVLASVPIAKNAGEWLQARVFQGFTNALIVRHAQLGKQLLPWAAAVFVVSVAAWGIPFLVARGKAGAALESTGVRVVVMVLAVVLAGISVLQVYRIGDAGAKASWLQGQFCAQPYVNDQCPAG